MLLFPYLHDAVSKLQQGSMCTLAWGRVWGVKMLKMGQTKGCMGVKQRNSLPRDVAPPEQTGQDEMK